MKGNVGEYLYDFASPKLFLNSACANKLVLFQGLKMDINKNKCSKQRFTGLQLQRINCDDS
jgi:hypothetical protein